mmetsp:Transcript_43548/g.111341  ORF Transcript_43548/g.111341 Transcript_43548/m.111341 type:complete len:246 (-) Transcript_43548:211-948(-)
MLRERMFRRPRSPTALRTFPASAPPPPAGWRPSLTSSARHSGVCADAARQAVHTPLIAASSGPPIRAIASCSISGGSQPHSLYQPLSRGGAGAASASAVVAAAAAATPSCAGMTGPLGVLSKFSRKTLPVPAALGALGGSGAPHGAPLAAGAVPKPPPLAPRCCSASASRRCASARALMPSTRRRALGTSSTAGPSSSCARSPVCCRPVLLVPTGAVPVRWTSSSNRRHSSLCAFQCCPWHFREQ